MKTFLEFVCFKFYSPDCSGIIKLNIQLDILLLSLLRSNYEHANEQVQIECDVLHFLQALFYVCTQTKAAPRIIVS